jgi:hypothetical protein
MMAEEVGKKLRPDPNTAPPQFLTRDLRRVQHVAPSLR